MGRQGASLNFGPALEPRGQVPPGRLPASLNFGPALEPQGQVPPGGLPASLNFDPALKPRGQAPPGGLPAPRIPPAPLSAAAVATEMKVKYVTFLERTYPNLSENQQGFWWRKRMQEVGFATYEQVAMGYDRIICNPDSTHTLFISQRNTKGVTNPAEIVLQDGSRVPLTNSSGNI